MPILGSLLRAIASQPRAYVIQRAAGRERIYGYIRGWVEESSGRGFIVDVGGGTGGIWPILPSNVRHVCLDVDRGKVSEYRRKHPTGLPVQADAACIPLASASTEFAVMVGVSHHLTDDELRLVLSEIRRILTTGGLFVFVDALYAPARLASRLIWAYDRGAFPRTDGALRQILCQQFRLIESATPCLWHHQYLVCLAQPFVGLITGSVPRGASRGRWPSPTHPSNES